MSNFGKKLSTFEFLYSLQKRTLLTEKPVLRSLFHWFFSAAPKFLVDFSQQVHNERENSNCLYTCLSLTLPINGLFKFYGNFTWKKTVYFLFSFTKYINGNTLKQLCQCHGLCTNTGRLMPCPFTGRKMFCASPNVLSQSKNLTAFSASSKTFVLEQKPILLNANHLFVWHKMFVTGTMCK